MPLRREGHLTFKYLARVFAFALVVASCTPLGTARTPSASATPTLTASSAATAQGLDRLVGARNLATRRWQTVPDGLTGNVADFAVEFDGDPSAGSPVARLRGGGRAAPFVATAGKYHAGLDLRGLAPGRYSVEVVERVAGTDVVVASTEFVLSQPEYVVWTLDFEGDASSDAAMANTAAIADALSVPMTVMWNPRVWTTAQVSPARAAAMQAWTKARAALGDEVALHLHMWTDFVRAAGLAARTTPSWAGRGDGYDVPMTAYSEGESKTLLEYSLKLMADHDMPRPTTFRAGGQFANAANLRALASLGFVADCSAVPAGAFGRLPYPWTLGPAAQPYRPSATDANIAGDMTLLEAPTIGGNTFGNDGRTIQPIIRANLSHFAPAGEIAMERRAVTIVSHPGTIDTTERAAIEALFKALAPLRYDSDTGPLRFVTLAQLAQAWR